MLHGLFCKIFVLFFLILPVVFLLIRLYRKKNMPWWGLFLLISVCGWFCVNAAVYFKFEHLAWQVSQYDGDPPPELLREFTSDGAQRVFARLFGWLYGLIYSLPWLMIYAVYVLARRLILKVTN